MNIKSYKDLEAYKKSYENVKSIYKLTQSFPGKEIYGLTSQIRRACISIPSNIAEGYMRGSKEYVQFLKVALGSSAELETQLSLSRDIGFCKDSDIRVAYERNIEVTKLLITYIKRLTK